MMMMMMMVMVTVMVMLVVVVVVMVMVVVVMVVMLFSQKINDTVNLTKNNTDVAGNGKEHQVQMIFSCLFLPLGFYGNAISLSWSERLRDRLHSALAEVWSEGTQCDQTTGNNDLATALRTVTNDTNEPGQIIFQGSTFCTKKRLTV